MSCKAICKRIFITALFFIIPLTADASIVLNEIFSDPATGLFGDANNDGVRSSTQDEFIEILNFNMGDVDISGWSLSDSVSTRHVFSANTILSNNSFLAVFGGGSPSLPAVNWQTASTGSLGLNNGGDQVSLFNADALLVDQMTYGSIGNNDQSLTRFPDGEGEEFVLHSTLEQAQGALFSPGLSVDSQLYLVSNDEFDPIDNPIVPELPTLIYFGAFWGPLLLKKFHIG